ncbi:hypothetical protein EDD73_1344 [Heliophilum fasciatum]|uniref:Uncharacterized protein n=2 Tax=Heliophilum fasciatum TaxID=35700 RepID=A0A4R2RBP1_9FIRM|nr:hypothetical protein EDD73_1344 [Heliophilum fasciatum]
MLTMLLIAIPVLAIALYTFRYGQFLWRNDHKPAAVGTYVLALAVVAAPWLVLWSRR